MQVTLHIREVYQLPPLPPSSQELDSSFSVCSCNFVIYSYSFGLSTTSLLLRHMIQAQTIHSYLHPPQILIVIVSGHNILTIRVFSTGIDKHTEPILDILEGPVCNCHGVFQRMRPNIEKIKDPGDLIIIQREEEKERTARLRKEGGGAEGERVVVKIGKGEAKNNKVDNGTQIETDTNIFLPANVTLEGS